MTSPALLSLLPGLEVVVKTVPAALGGVSWQAGEPAGAWLTAWLWTEVPLGSNLLPLPSLLGDLQRVI